MSRALSLLTVTALAATALVGCTEAKPTDTAGNRSIGVTSTASGCELTSTSAPAGHLTFTVSNKGSEVTEFYLLAEDGLRIVGEVENIGPGLTRDLVLTTPDGKYLTACKPGMKGEGIRADFVVTPSEETVRASGDTEALVAAANKNYGAYVQDQSAQLLDATTKFVGLYTSGKDDEARALYPMARTHWERIETVAESFGDLDPKMDLREADLEPGQEWTGWHRIEKDLWPERAKDYTAATTAERQALADDLLANTQTLDNRVQDLTYSVAQIANGSRGLLDEVATGKVTGEEEFWSRTDLWDFQANVDGARVGFEGVEPIVSTTDPELATEITDRFAALQTLLDRHRKGDGFVSYDTLTTEQVKALSDAVNALSEPLSKLAAATI